MASLSPVRLGTIIFIGFLPFLLIRKTLVQRLVVSAGSGDQPRRAFLIDFTICLGASLLVSIYTFYGLGFPVTSLLSFTIGCLIAGFFIGIESSLAQERKVILDAMEKRADAPLPTRIFSLTRKFTMMAGTVTLFVSIVLVLVFVRDIDWLVRTTLDAGAMRGARMSVLFEVLFIMGILMILILSLIFSYSKNINLLFTNQTRILEQVREGDLTEKVPVATRDEFGLIAGHTNHMIDGLRHRFELMDGLRFAEEVQQNLLPTKSPFLREFDICGSSSFCDQTGGDYFDYFLLNDHKFGIVVADSCGHGVGAAMLMISVRAYFISAVQQYSDPASLITAVNSVLVDDCSANNTFTTLFFLELDQQKKIIRWVRAGHEPAHLYHTRTEKFSELAGKGIALGLEDSFQFETQCTDELESGDIILIGTDGIHETFDRNHTLFGKDRVQEIIVKHRHESALVIKDALVREVGLFRDGLPQEDDITLVVIKVK